MRLLPRCTHHNDKFIKWDCHAPLAMTPIHGKKGTGPFFTFQNKLGIERGTHYPLCPRIHTYDAHN
jgi:hypothetical protein